MINVVVCDDHPLIQEGVKRIVHQTTDIQVTAEASRWEELYSVLRRCKGGPDLIPDLIILDINLPGKSGLDILKDLKVLFPRLPVLMLSMHSETRFAIRTLKAGAWGYLNKSKIANELVRAIRKILERNEKYISSEVARILAEKLKKNLDKKDYERLSDREYQVFCKIASGKKVKEIADDLSLSIQTVYTYRANIKEKMNFDSNVEMTRYAIRNNLVE